MSEIVGRYVGQLRVRPELEDQLTALEKKQLAKGNDRIPLDIHPDGTFLYKGATSGRYTVEADIAAFNPESLGGETLDDLIRKSEEAGREFRLHFLFEPFKLRITEDHLESIEDSSTLYTHFVRQ